MHDAWLVFSFDNLSTLSCDVYSDIWMEITLTNSIISRGEGGLVIFESAITNLRQPESTEL